MNLERYEIVRMNEFSYRFFSIGPKGVFKMHIHFTMTGANSFNLGFGVLDSSHEWLDDMIEVRNGDTQKILATVAHTALVFLEEHPSATIYASGSTPPRTRLYQMGISRVLPHLHGYSVAGLIVKRDSQGGTEGTYPTWKGIWYTFQSGVCYDAFLIFKT
jgi:hypothetical protein